VWKYCKHASYWC